MQSTVVYVLYGTVVLCAVFVGRLGAAGSDGALPAAGQPGGANVNTTVAKVIDAMLADGPKHDGAIPIPEHHHDKAQRIVPRKGVDNEGSFGSGGSARLLKSASTSPNVGPSTSQSAPVVASDDKPNVVATVASALAAGKSAEAHNATGGAGDAPKGSSAPPQLSLGNATTIANKTTVASTSSISSSSSTSSSSSSSSSSTSSAISSVVSSTAAPSQSKPPVVGGPTVTPRASIANSTSSTTSNSTATSSTTTATTNSTTTATTTTTTKPPKKPKVTYSVEDEPKLLQAAKPGYASPYDTVDSNGRLRVDEPLAQLSKEYIPQSPLGGRDAPNSRREFVVPIVTLIFAIPLLLGLFLLSYRRAKEFWLTRHYRRMDFLIDGMYNY